MHCRNAIRLDRVSSRSLALAALVSLAAYAPTVFAIGAMPPVYEAPHTRIRLFTGGLGQSVGGGQPVVGIEIAMEPGWKTYWRTPGEGISPSFSWDESLNLQDARVLWPAPIRFADGDGTSIGYKEKVVLPVLITPQDPAKPVSLSLAVAYGICKDICMPVEAQLSLDIDMPARKADSDDLRRTLAMVPKRQDDADVACPHRFRSARLVQIDGKPALRVDTAFDTHALLRDLMVEAPQEAGLAAPTLEAGSAAGSSTYVFALPAEGVAAVKDRTLTFTTVSDRGSCESISRVE